MNAKEPCDHVGHPGREAEVGRIFGPLDTLEAKALVVALELAPAGQMEDGAGLAPEERLDDRGPDAFALPFGDDGDRGQFAASVAVRFDLAPSDDLSVLLDHHEVRPLKVHPGKMDLPNEAPDCGLVVGGGGAEV